MSERLRVLMVDDDPVDRMAFERFIKSGGADYEYVLASSVAEARLILTTQTFDAVVTDHNLGDGSAFDVMEKTGKTPTVVVTGSGNEELAVKALKEGARDYLIKDYERNYLKVLPATVQNAVDRFRIEAERERLLKELQEAVGKINTLQGLLPICACCKKIRDDDGYWHRIETYITQHSQAEFTHSYCPDCMEKTLREIKERKAK